MRHVHQPRHGLAQRILVPKAEHPRERGVEVNHPPGAVGGQQGAVGPVGAHAQEPVTRAFGLLASDLGADVAGNLEDAARSALFIEDRAVAGLDPDRPAIDGETRIPPTQRLASQQGAQGILVKGRLGPLGGTEGAVMHLAFGGLRITEELQVVGVGAQQHAIGREFGERLGTFQGGQQGRLFLGLRGSGRIAGDHAREKGILSRHSVLFACVLMSPRAGAGRTGWLGLPAG
ncbi:hypothetical protein D3C77_454280 [compost metagenome]